MVAARASLGSSLGSIFASGRTMRFFWYSVDDRSRDGLAVPVFEDELRFRGRRGRIAVALLENGLRFESQAFGLGGVRRNGQDAATENSK